jgi:hypothetical protein
MNIQEEEYFENAWKKEGLLSGKYQSRILWNACAELMQKEVDYWKNQATALGLAVMTDAVSNDSHNVDCEQQTNESLLKENELLTRYFMDAEAEVERLVECLKIANEKVELMQAEIDRRDAELEALRGFAVNVIMTGQYGVSHEWIIQVAIANKLLDTQGNPTPLLKGE